MQLFYYFFIIFTFILLFIKKKDFVIWLPLVYVVLDSSFSYFTTLSIITYVKPTIFLILLFFFRQRIHYNNLTKPIINFLGYTFVLVFFSSEVFYSFKGYLQVFISMMCLLIGFAYFNHISKLHELNKSIFILVVFSVVASALGYLFDIGRAFDYDFKSSDPETIGLLGSSGMYSAAVAIGILPILLISIQRVFWRWILFLAAIAAYIFILLNVRRTAIFIPVVGLLAFTWFSTKKLKAVSQITFALGILILLSPLYADKLLLRFTVREEQGRFEEDFYETENRYLENIETWTSVFSFQDPIKSLFGSKIYASGREGEERKHMLHSDTAVLLGGTGIIGFLLYVGIYIKLFRFGKYKGNSNIPHYKLLKSTYYSLIFISLFVSLNGSLLIVTLRSIIFLYLGAILSLMVRSNIKDNQDHSNISKNGIHF